MTVRTSLLAVIGGTLILCVAGVGGATPQLAVPEPSTVVRSEEAAMGDVFVSSTTAATAGAAALSDVSALRLISVRTITTAPIRSMTRMRQNLPLGFALLPAAGPLSSGDAVWAGAWAR